MIVDAGTGDGRAVLARARAEPGALVVGIDADARTMAEASRRAARRTERGGAPNALFLVAAAETLPGPLAGSASLVTITFPWGSLLAGVVGRAPAVTAGLAGLVAPGGRVDILASIEPSDGVAGLDHLDDSACERIAGAWHVHGLDLVCLRRATAAEVDASGSTWGRRLTRGGGAGRSVWRIELAARLR